MSLIDEMHEVLLFRYWKGSFHGDFVNSSLPFVKRSRVRSMLPRSESEHDGESEPQDGEEDVHHGFEGLAFPVFE